jgi:hypothetical protein
MIAEGTPLLVHSFSSRSLAERRVTDRRDCFIDATTRPANAQDTVTWGATVRDLSHTGVGLVLCFPFRAGTYLAIDLKRDTLLAKVVHVEDQNDGSWNVGCEFVRPLSDEELSRLTA